MAAPRQGLPVRLERAPHRGAAFALNNASKRARTRSIGSRSRGSLFIGNGCRSSFAAKRVEIAREAFPRATVLGIAFDTISSEQRDAAAEAARKLGLEPRMIEVKGQHDYGGAFNAMDDARGQPIILPASPMFFRDREAIAQALLERRIPSVAAFRENMEAGALISYGFDLMGLFYDIASYVHQIARGAKPSDMPIEQSPRFYMAVNLKTAASLGVSLSDVFIARANEVRE